MCIRDSNDSIHNAVDEWKSDRSNAINTYGNIHDWDTSDVTNMGNLFAPFNSFNDYIGSWNTSKVTNMIDMFNTAQSFNQDIKSWDVSKVIKSGVYKGFAYNSPLCKSNKAYIPDGLKASIACPNVCPKFNIALIPVSFSS